MSLSYNHKKSTEIDTCFNNYYSSESHKNGDNMDKNKGNKTSAESQGTCYWYVNVFQIVMKKNLGDNLLLFWRQDPSNKKKCLSFIEHKTMVKDFLFNCSMYTYAEYTHFS